MLAGSVAAQAATLRVTTTKDETTSGDGKCSLREAITTVDTPGTKTDCGTADYISNIIVLGPRTYDLSIPPTPPDDNSSGDLDLTSSVPLQIVGSGPATTVVRATTALQDRLLTISNRSSVQLTDLALTGGAAPDGSSGAGCSAGGKGGDGGAVLNDGGSLFLLLVRIRGNHAGAGGSGGAGLRGCNGGNGGAIYNNRGVLSVTSSTISGNSAGAGGRGGDGAPDAGMNGGAGGAGGSGGGIDNYGGDVLIGGTTHQGAGDTFTRNRAGVGGHGGAGSNGIGGSTGGNGGAGGNGGDGGALYTTIAGAKHPGSLQVTNTTLTGNKAGNAGAGGKGGFGGGGGSGGAGGDGGDGGAIAGISSPSGLLNVTVARNRAGKEGDGGSGGGGSGPGGSLGTPGTGGGLYADPSTGSGTMRLMNSLIASNSPANCYPASPSSAIVDGGHNLSFADKSCPAVTNARPMLKKLNDYGGPTKTMALAPGSAAIDQVPAKGAECPRTDQRGVSRPQGPACDIGAFEFAVPKIAISSPRNGARYKRGTRVLASFTCTEGQHRSPIATCTGTVPNGLPIDTRTLGKKTFTVTARDKAGNVTTKTVHYTVVRLK